MHRTIDPGGQSGQEGAADASPNARHRKPCRTKNTADTFRPTHGTSGMETFALAINKTNCTYGPGAWYNATHIACESIAQRSSAERRRPLSWYHTHTLHRRRAHHQTRPTYRHEELTKRSCDNHMRTWTPRTTIMVLPWMPSSSLQAVVKNQPRHLQPPANPRGGKHIIKQPWTKKAVTAALASHHL